MKDWPRTFKRHLDTPGRLPCVGLTEEGQRKREGWTLTSWELTSRIFVLLLSATHPDVLPVGHHTPGRQRSLPHLSVIITVGVESEFGNKTQRKSDFTFSVWGGGMPAWYTSANILTLCEDDRKRREEKRQRFM